MPSFEVGDRVGLIHRYDNDRIWYFGAGILVGYELPPYFPSLDEGMEILKEKNTKSEIQSYYKSHSKTTKYVLDDGSVVWGSEIDSKISHQEALKLTGARLVIPVKVERDGRGYGHRIVHAITGELLKTRTPPDWWPKPNIAKP